ncbi:Uncharacterised protein [Escherichia coli]|uniref:hypothetical protein n=1 Tax=Enterobacter mori TaxID=539813 RepID=UPI0015E544F2|nr:MULTISPECIES: hypothetical protein [Enterobacteriaceae]QLO06842.1 hypothetical protein HV141_25575 [Citrobacter freundii]VVY57707.1 Uncharacterised protein [Escherichia coli]VVZ63952.1 Uncharacterised protein [Escherichia coli]VWN03525.1 Uncharacterised protein [Escherichia coli]
MTIVYGSCIEPGGMELEDHTIIAECKNCGKDCRHRIYEDCVGGAINQRFSYTCNHCGYHSCNAEVCLVCDSIEHEEHAKRYRSNIFFEIHELIELMKIEGDILAIRAKINIGAHDFEDLSRLEECLHSLIYPGYYERRNTGLYKQISDASTDMAINTWKRLERLLC